MEKLTIRYALTISMILLGCTGTNAQFNHVGIRTGVNISKIHIANGDFAQLFGKSDRDYKAGFNFGLISQASSNNIIATSIGLFYTNSGCKDSAYRLSMHSIKIPLEFKARIPVYGPVIIQVGLGPYISYAFLAKETIGGISDEDILSLRSKNEGGNITTGDLKTFNPLDAGIVFGGDVEVKLPNKSFIAIGFNYELGILNVSNEWNLTEGIPDAEDSWVNPGFKNNIMSINVTYSFDVTKENKKKK